MFDHFPLLHNSETRVSCRNIMSKSLFSFRQRVLQPSLDFKQHFVISFQRHLTITGIMVSEMGVFEARAVNFHTSRVPRSTMPVNVWVVRLLLIREIHHARPIEINGAKRALACCFHDHDDPLPIGRFLRCEVLERRSVALEDREEAPEIALLLRQRDFPVSSLHNGEVWRVVTKVTVF